MSRARATTATLLVFVASCGPFPKPARPPGILRPDLIGNLYAVDSTLYRSAQPDDDTLPALEQALGLTLIIQLDGAIEAREDPPGRARVWRVALPGVVGAVDPFVLIRIADAIEQERTTGGHVLIHCLHGEDRTGLIVALYRVRHGATPEAALGEAMRHGFHPTLPSVWGAWVRAVGWIR